MRTIYISILTYIVINIAGACTKHAGDYTVIPKASIIFSAPQPDKTNKASDSIRVNAVLIAPAIIHGYDVYLTTQADTARLQSISIHDHNDTLVVDQKFAPMSTGKYQAHILVHLDHNGNTEHKAVNFQTQ